MILINAAPLPSPTGFRLLVHDARGTKQLNALGQTVRDVMGQKRRVEIMYKRLGSSAMQQLRTLLPENAVLSLTCPAMSGDETFSCYLDNLSCALFSREKGENVWTDVKIVLEEV